MQVDEDGKCDIYSLGVVMAVIYTQSMPSEHARPNFNTAPTWLRQLLERMTHEEPSQRPPAEDVQEKLLEAAAEAEAKARAEARMQEDARMQEEKKQAYLCISPSVSAYAPQHSFIQACQPLVS